MTSRTFGILATVFAITFIVATLFGCWHRADAIERYFVERAMEKRV